MTKKTVLVVTGIRSEYDIISHLLSEIKNHAELELKVIATGAHLSDRFGYTISNIESDSFKIEDRLYNLIDTDDAVGRAKGLGVQMQDLSQSVSRIDPDMLLVFGDREEAMTTSLVGQYLNIPVAHLSGGDSAIYNVDDQVRHAVTKLSHLHFATNKDSYDRILRLGEQSFRVYNVGNPGLDRLVRTPNLSLSELSDSIGFELNKERPFVLLIQHALSTEIDQAYDQMKSTLKAVDNVGVKTVISYPNSDAGSRRIIDAIEEYEKKPHIHTSEHIPRLEFVNLMRHASCMVGNSSAGILEAPLLDLPVINIGNRQKGRLHADNVVFVNHDVNQIQNALEKVLHTDGPKKAAKNCDSPYGDGDSSQRISQILADVDINDSLLVKDITY